jgi:S-DNA-T family DNA segregation ATPase FtsK/SpoIIIE
MDSCDRCGFRYDDISTDEIPVRLVDAGARYRIRLLISGPPPVEREGIRTRPAPAVWSPLEYACHLRDVLDVQRGRLMLALAEDRPTFVPMGRDERVVADSYNLQDPREVVAAIEERSAAIADAFSTLTRAQWERTGIYNWPEEEARTMAWLGRHTLHESLHHLGDIDAQLGTPET